MRLPTTLIAALAILASAPAFAQGAPHGTSQPAGPGTVRGVGCQKDAFGATRCADGTTFPGGPFGVTAHKPAKAAPVAGGSAANRPAAAMPDPATMIRGDAAAAGNLYGDPTAMPRGTDGYGCRTTPEGRLNCD